MIHRILGLLLTWVVVTAVLIPYNAAEDPECHFNEQPKADDEPSA